VTETSETALAEFKQAMRRMPGTVALITTRDGDAPVGLAASAVIPVSMEPPSMLISVNRSASPHLAIKRSGRFCVNLLGTAHTDFVLPFSQSALRDKRFASDLWDHDEDLPYLSGACANIFCHVRQTVEFGTHELFIGEVLKVRRGPDTLHPLGWMEGGFARLEKLG
jgi:flavin reductase (DIM6/NTAB) family NADH-FMN oxidoreductase RutF